MSNFQKLAYNIHQFVVGHFLTTQKLHLWPCSAFFSLAPLQVDGTRTVLAQTRARRVRPLAVFRKTRGGREFVISTNKTVIARCWPSDR